MILVTGARGQLGYDIMRELDSRYIPCMGVGSRELDITDAAAVDEMIGSLKPDALIHCAAWTKVDDAEDHADEARAVNEYGTANLARAAEAIGASFMYFSTDYVFNGEGNFAWRPDDPTGPIGVYGKTKLAGEKAVRDIYGSEAFILRLQWVYGINGHNFVKTMLRLAKTRDTLTVVDDQIGAPSYTADIAGLVADMIMTESFGTYHVANTGYISWYEFARAIFNDAGIENINVIPVSSEDYPTRAKRPKNSRFDTSLITERGFTELPPWDDALRRFMTELRSREPELF